MTEKIIRAVVLVAGIPPEHVHCFGACLEEQGHCVIEINDPADTMEMATAVRPDLILMAAAMEPVDGLTICGRMKADSGTRDIPVVLLLQEDTETLVARAYAVGADDCFPPPRQWQCLALRINHYLCQRNAVKELKNQLTKLHRFRVSAKAATREKSEFLAHISHELHTPMHGILSYARFGLKRVDKAPREKLKEYFREIEESGQRLLNMLNDSLELATLEAGRVEYNLRRQDIVAEVKTVVDELVHLAEEKQMTLETCTPEQPVPVLFDRLWLDRIVRILVVNGIQLSGPGDTVRVGIRKKQGNRMMENIVEISIVDQGGGVEEEVINQEVDTFFHNGMTREDSLGTAMGLSICSRVVQDHHGTISMRRNPDGGTIFSLVLPVLAENKQ